MKIHQALHGYSKGHRLLAASVPLPPAATRQLLDLTDANDVSEDPDFPSVVAGFPLVETEFYALTKTWPDPQSRRVGSVWTHTLLIDRAAPPFGARALLEAFSRPKGKGRGSFETPLEIADIADRVRPDDFQKSERIATVLWALYEAPARPVIAVLDDLDSRSRQIFLLSLIVQQGPILGHDFAFAEAPRWPRTISGRPFDLHITGRGGVSDLRHGVGNVRLVSQAIESSAPAWAVTAAHELRGSPSFAEFIRMWGSGSPHGRSDLPALVGVWEILGTEREAPGQLKKLIRLIDRSFPRRGEMPKLKVGLFGAPSARILTSWPDAPMLEALATEPAARCLSIPDMAITQRVRALWSNDAERAFAVLQAVNNSRNTELARAIATASIERLDPDALTRIARGAPDLWAMLVTSDPAVVESTYLQRLEKKEARRLLSSVDNASRGAAMRGRIVAAMARKAPRRWRKEVQERFMSEVEGDPSAYLADRTDLTMWAPELSQEAIAKWLNSGHPESTDVLAAAAYFSRRTADLVRPDIWLRAVDALGQADARSDPGGLVTLLFVACKSKAIPGDALAIRALDNLWPVLSDLPSEVRADIRCLNQGKDQRSVTNEVLSAVAKGFRAFPEWRPGVVLQLKSKAALRALLEEDSRRGPRASSISYRLAEALPVPGMTADQYEVLQENLARHAKRDDLLGMLESVVRRVTGL